MAYNLNYLEKVPREFYCIYEGQPDFAVICKPEDFCDDPTVVSYEPNMDLDDSYHNWSEKLDLVCATPSQIGFVGSSIFIGWMITLTFVPRLADLYGRKVVMVIGASVIFIAYTVVMTTSNYTVFVCALFVCGMMSTIRV